MKRIVSDQGSHFVNKLIQEINTTMLVKHHFTTPYSLLANGSVERMCREVLRACMALLEEFKISPLDWAAVIHVIHSVLNQTSLKRLVQRDLDLKYVYRTPLQAFTRLKPRRPLLQALPYQNKVRVDTSLRPRPNKQLGFPRFRRLLKKCTKT